MDQKRRTTEKKRILKLKISCSRKHHGMKHTTTSHDTVCWRKRDIPAYIRNDSSCPPATMIDFSSSINSTHEHTSWRGFHSIRKSTDFYVPVHKATVSTAHERFPKSLLPSTTTIHSKQMTHKAQHQHERGQRWQRAPCGPRFFCLRRPPPSPAGKGRMGRCLRCSHPFK